MAGWILVTLLAAGCGGGSSGGGGNGGMDDITWPSRDGEPTTMLPPSVKTGRVVFSSQSGESCCVAVDPSILSGNAKRGLAILNDLPVGPATVTVAGFTTDFAPVVSGVTKTCSTIPANAARDCDPMQLASPAFESPPLSVVIIGGAQTNIGQVPMEAFPFLFSFSPGQGASAPAPVQFAMTVVDAATNVRAESVQLDVSFTVPDENPGSPFRVLTKRVPLSLVPCADGTTNPCSPTANLQLTGFNASGTAPELPEGPVEARVVAENTANPPHGLDFRYTFVVLATPTATATATATEATDAAEAAARAPSGSAAGSSAEGSAADDVAAVLPVPVAGETPSSRTDRSVNGLPPTPTATPAPGGAS
jgi:hypothetical protein